MKTLYEILQISQEASDKEIKDAYRKLAISLHPDKNPGKVEEATAYFQKLGYAYEILKDPQTRQAYNVNLKDGTIDDYTSYMTPKTKKTYTPSEDSIQNAWTFCRVLDYLEPAQRSVLFNKWKNTLSTLVGSIEEFNFVLKNINTTERLEFFKLMKKYLPSMYQKRGDIINVFNYINIKDVKDSVPSLIPCTGSFYEVMEYLNEEERADVFDAMEKELLALALKNKDYGFFYIFTFLNTEQRAKTFDLFKPQLLNFIKSWFDVKNVRVFLDPQQFEMMLVIVKDMLVAGLEGDIGRFTSNIEIGKYTKEDIIIIAHVMKEDLKQVIKQSGNIVYCCNKLATLLDKIDEPQKTLLLAEMIDSLPWISVDKSVLEDLIFKCAFKSSAHRLMVLQAIQGSLSKIIDIKELDNFLKKFFFNELERYQAKKLYFASLMEEFKDKINLSDLGEYNLIKVDEFNNFEEVESKLEGKNAIIVTRWAWDDKLYFANQNTHKLTPIFINDANKSQVKQIIKKAKTSLSTANKEELIVIKSLIGQIDINAKDKRVLFKLHEDLQTAAQHFFHCEPSEVNYNAFKNTCKDALNIARAEISHPNRWKEFFAILGLAIISFGIVPAALAISAKIKTGSWEFRIFHKPEHEQKIDEAEAIVRLIPPKI